MGTGAAAAGAVLALLEASDIRVTVIDIGGQLEAPNAATRNRLANQDIGAWSREDLKLVTRLPQDVQVAGLPEKRSYGSDYPFRDLGQLAGIIPGEGVNGAVVSAPLAA